MLTLVHTFWLVVFSVISYGIGRCQWHHRPGQPCTDTLIARVQRDTALHDRDVAIDETDMLREQIRELRADLDDARTEAITNGQALEALQNEQRSIAPVIHLVPSP